MTRPPLFSPLPCRLLSLQLNPKPTVVSYNHIGALLPVLLTQIKLSPQSPKIASKSINPPIPKIDQN
ncbi:Uncharacterized protein TCM_029085 [Theobroma cacao]|uniref:Uncharacterized protein n=1 Tax=Theobroma cacao TaxID=3641 RepID=A0A061GC99_THECC|nr:Uncharacterized protein TCM_029085 [Theobroma cacao]